MIYSKPCEYAIRALSYLAANPRTTARADEMARAEGLPPPILAKILQELVRKGLLASQRGPGGGFRLARRPELITLRDIVAAIDGLDQFVECAVGLDRCSDDSPCPVHQRWKPVRAHFMQFLETTTLDAMAKARTREKQAPARASKRGRAGQVAAREKRQP